KWPRLAQLRVLHLNGNDLGNAGVAALAAAPLGNLRQLNLSDSKLGDAGACALAAAPLDHLTRLVLLHNRIRSRGVIALARSPHLEGIEVLNLTGDAIGSRAAAALRERFGRRVKLDGD